MSTRTGAKPEVRDNRRSVSIDVEYHKAAQSEQSAIELEQAEYDASLEKRTVSKTRLLLITLGFSVVEFEWAVLYALANPLLSHLGTPHTLMSMAWFASPVAILFVQPLAGAYSDRCEHRWGRRRPFLFFSGIFAVVAMLIIPNCEDLALLISAPGYERASAIGLAMFGVMLLDLTNELIYYFLRALLGDVLPTHQSEVGMALSSFMMSVGGLLGNLIGSMDMLPLFPSFKSNLHISFLVCTFFFITGFFFSCTLVKEKPFRRRPGSTVEASAGTIIREIFTYVRNLPHALFVLCLVDFFSWFALFSFFMYATEWVGENVFHGSASSSDPDEVLLFEAGVRMGAMNLAFTSVVSLCFAPFIPRIIPRLGLKRAYLYSHLILAASLMLPTMWSNSKFAVAVLFSLIGIPYAVDESLPYVILGRYQGERNVGLSLAVLQNFAVFSKMVISIGMGSIVTFFGNNLSAALITGGISALIASFLITRLPDPDAPVKEREST